MPGARSRVKPAPASEFSASDEASQLELYLQRQLEEDVARIFDESIYSDLEVVCGKLKILTHSCILKARTNNFYHKLQTILHVNIERNTFDEIYSFISDAYTECNIKHQEKEIINYLDENLNILISVSNKSNLNGKEEVEESEVYLTPKCVTPYREEGLQKALSSSPSTELTKEYYALVPIEGNLLDKELTEQDALSNAFQSIFKSQLDFNRITVTQQKKPTSLFLSSSHRSKTVKHSNSCDILNNHLEGKTTFQSRNNSDQTLDIYSSQTLEKSPTLESNKIEKIDKNSNWKADKSLDPAYSPDSLITDEPSSSSDYLSAAYTCSPGVSSICGIPQLNVVDNITKMENAFTSSDSGLENTGLLESLSSHKDVTLTDLSLTESTLHDLTADEAHEPDSGSSSCTDKNQIPKHKTGLCATTNKNDVTTDMTESNSNQQARLKDIPIRKSSKEEKQRQNEEIVILESSSLSSETGSWESVFPPKTAVKEICEKFIYNEQQQLNKEMSKEGNTKGENFTESRPSLVQKSPFKSTSCFIDAASLVDDEDDSIKVQSEINNVTENARNDMIPAPSEPMPCSTAKLDISPNDWSESNENEDSLEQIDKKDPDSIQKDLSPTIFEMTPITEDSLCSNTFENAVQIEENARKHTEVKEIPQTSTADKESIIFPNAIFVSSTPNNSIMSLKVSSLKQYESEESENDATTGRENYAKKSLSKYNECSPIVSGGASIEDHLPQMISLSGSPVVRRKIENIPIVSGAYIPTQEDDSGCRKSPKPSSASAWVVDMSSSSKTENEQVNNSNNIIKKPADRVCSSLRNGSYSSYNQDSCNKSRSSVDSDSSEKSSHKFYIDLSSLPDQIPAIKTNQNESTSEKKNIFSMFIDLGEHTSVKEMPSKLSSSLTRKVAPETKKTSKSFNSEKSFTNDTLTFEKYESLCNNPDISISEIIGNISAKPPDPEISTNLKDQPKAKNNSNGNKNSKVFCENERELDSADLNSELFVKLSDLDKPVQKAESSLGKYEEKVLDIRMTRSDNNWREQTNTSCKSIEVISSFHSENALSLNRLFPHLKNEFSRSMPGCLPGRTRSPARLAAISSPGELESHASDMSEISSVQSSVCRSVIENSTPEETSQTSSLIDNCQSRLGQDLLRMFLEEIAPDVIVEVSGRRIKAHKCILSSRCQYFAGILSGGWVESAGNVIVLPPFSFNVVHFALCHIYSGVSTIPDSISIVELATIADMLGLEGLKEAIMFTLKAKYCHHFHRPCQVCTAGVLECFPLSSVYGLDDLYRKCLRWITKYFSKVWPTKAFATLPKELLDKCYQQHVANLTTDNFVDTVYGCGITVASLQNSRWAESVARLCQRVVNAAAHFAAKRLVGVLRAAATRADAPQPPAPPPAHHALDDCLAAAIEWASPDDTCRAYAFLSAHFKEIRSQHSKPDLISNGSQHKTAGYNSLLYNRVFSWLHQCEEALVRAAPRVVNTQAFKDLPPDLRKRLRELGCIMYGTQSVPNTSVYPDKKNRSPYNSRPKSHASSATRSLDIDHVRASFVPYAPKPKVTVGSTDVLVSNSELRDKKMKNLNPPKIRTTKAQEERAKFNLSKNNKSKERLNYKNAGPRITFENTKPRYLEPKTVKDNEKRSAAHKKLAPKMISSSESSRNSSPIQARNARSSRLKSGAESGAGAGMGSRLAAMSQDSLATSSRPHTAEPEPSTDSLSESHYSNKYATYTKTKHTTKGSIESVTSARLPTNSANNKLKTKIPVYLNQGGKPNYADTRTEAQKRNQACKTSNAGAGTQARARTAERKVPGSLMNATKSSSAKMVAKIVKETTPSKNTPKSGKKTTNPPNRYVEAESPRIPVMERSGTFLKDEPTFGDMTTNIDIDQ